MWREVREKQGIKVKEIEKLEFDEYCMNEEVYTGTRKSMSSSSPSTCAGIYLYILVYTSIY